MIPVSRHSAGEEGHKYFKVNQLSNKKVDSIIQNDNLAATNDVDMRSPMVACTFYN